MPAPENLDTHSAGNRRIIDVPSYPRAYAMPAAIHEALDPIVSGANYQGARTKKGEMVAALIHHAFTGMSNEELAAVWLTYRRSDEQSLSERPSFPSE